MPHSEIAKGCFKCGAVKSISEFYAHAKMADGHLGKCKSCARIDVQENRSARLAQYRQRDIERDRTSAKRRSDRRAANERARRLHPEKAQAQLRARRAVRAGRIAKLPCEVCGAKAEAHHDDYSKPLDVRWLCRQHHNEHHAALRRAARRAA